MKTIQQTVRFAESPEKLFDTYLDSRRHAAVTGRRVVISRRIGGSFKAFDGVITGKNLLIVPKRLIVQAWRARHWNSTDLDSVLILTFSKVRGGGRISLTHVNVPDHDAVEVNKGWHSYYWKPWRAYLDRDTDGVRSGRTHRNHARG